MSTIGLVESIAEASGSKKDLFGLDTSFMGYPTRLTPIFDYKIGYNVHVYEGEQYIKSYPSLGIRDGSCVMVCGKSSTAKTTMCVQIAANIVRPYEQSFVLHFDIERALNYTRIHTLTRFPMKVLAQKKYILQRRYTSIDDIKKAIAGIYFEKTSHPEKYLVHEKTVDEFNQPVTILAPTVVVVDSIATLLKEVNDNTKDGKEARETVTTQTDKMRLAGEIARFYNEILPMLSAANIIFIAINHIHARGSIGVPQPAELLFLGQDEALPGGKTPPYLSSTLLKNTAIGSEKYNIEADGFDGFGIRVKTVKSRGNANNQEMDFVFDSRTGVDFLRTNIKYLEGLGLVGGDKRGKYFLDHKEVKWKPKTIYQDFLEHPELSDMMYDMLIPSLQSCLQEKPEEQTETNILETIYRY